MFFEYIPIVGPFLASCLLLLLLNQMIYYTSQLNTILLKLRGKSVKEEPLKGHTLKEQTLKEQQTLNEIPKETPSKLTQKTPSPPSKFKYKRSPFHEKKYNSSDDNMDIHNHHTTVKTCKACNQKIL